MFDESSGIDHRTLIGHSGPVLGVSFSPGKKKLFQLFIFKKLKSLIIVIDKYYVISGSEDGTGTL